jgi:hypothetical protein
MRRVSCPGIGQGVAAGVPEHVRVDRKGEASALADALDEPSHRVGRAGRGREAHGATKSSGRCFARRRFSPLARLP